MSRPAISTKHLTTTLSLSECHDGWWLYDETRGMNLSMRAKTPEAAFVEALTYYQNRLQEFERAYWQLRQKIDDFVSQVATSEDEE